MTVSRRRFLQAAGASALLGAGCDGPLARFMGSAPAGSEILAGPRTVFAGRWGMAIDMRRLEDPELRRRIIDACHRAHNVPDVTDPVREIKWIWEDSFEHVFPGSGSRYLAEDVEKLPFLLLCNHCENPPCVRVCPTKATFKRDDGIVMMDYHRCIGCRFCMAGCPYGSRSFNFWDPRPYIAEINPQYPTRTRGVVEKCDFCAERLAAGLMPICAEQSAGAIVFGDLEDPRSDVRRVLAERYAIQRKPQLGTEPAVFYVIG